MNACLAHLEQRRWADSAEKKAVVDAIGPAEAKRRRYI